MLDISPVNPDRRRTAGMEGLYVNVVNGAPCRGSSCLGALIRASGQVINHLNRAILLMLRDY